MEKEGIEIPGMFYVSLALITVLAVGFCLMFFIFFAKRKQHFRQKKMLEVQFQQALLQTQIEIQEQTLKTISQEIHDNVGQVLSLAKLNLGTFEGFESETNQVKVNDTKQLVSKAINDLRDLSKSLYGNKITELGLQEAIASELKILQNTGQYNTSIKVIGEGYKLEPQKEMVLFRIIQEGMNNSIKHAGAKNISITMSYQPSIFSLIIADDGSGFDLQALHYANTGIGLSSMQNRATLIGAEFLLDSQVGTGTRITVLLKND